MACADADGRVNFVSLSERFREGPSKNGLVKIAQIGEREVETGSAPASPRLWRGDSLDGSSGSRGDSPLSETAGPALGLSVVGRLRRRFGLGDDAKRRMVLYKRLQVMVERHGEVVLRLISEAAAGAAGKDNEGRWFCRAICAKLCERGITAKGGGDHAAW